MTTKDFLIRLFSLTIVLIVLYYMFSPYQNCKRENVKKYGNDLSGMNKTINHCLEKTSW